MNTLLLKNIRTLTLVFLALTTSINSGLLEVNIPGLIAIDSKDCIDILKEYNYGYPKVKADEYPESKKLLNKIGTLSINVITGIYKFGFNNYHNILSKKFLAASIIACAPYLYFSDTNVLEALSQCAADFVFKMSGAIAGGTLNAVVSNPVALGKIVAALTVSRAGQKIVEKVGIKLAEVLLTVITLGAIR